MSLSSGEPKPIISNVARGPSHAHTSTHAHTHTRTHIYTHTHRQANTLTKHAHLAHTDFPYWGTAARLQLHPSKDGYVKIFCSWIWPVGHDKKLQVNSYSTQKVWQYLAISAISAITGNIWQYLAMSGNIWHYLALSGNTGAESTIRSINIFPRPSYQQYLFML